MPQRQPMSRALLLTILLSIQAAAADVATLVKQCEDCHGSKAVSTGDTPPSPVSRRPYMAISCSLIRRRRGPAVVQVPAGRHFASRDRYVRGSRQAERCGYRGAGGTFRAIHSSPQSILRCRKAAAGRSSHARDCAKCHTDGGRNPDDDASILGGQHLKYLQQALADLRSGEREASKKMAEKLSKWTDADTEAAAHYYASLQ